MVNVPDTKTERDHYRDLWWQTALGLYQVLLSHARRISGNVFDAEDLVHETVCRVIRYPRDPNTLANPLSYLICIMKRVWLDRIVYEASRPTDSLDDPLKAQALEKQLPTIESEAFHTVEIQELREALDVLAGPLSSREWELLRMRLEGMTCEEIAEQWGEHVKVITYDWNALKAKVKYRVLKKIPGNASGH